MFARLLENGNVQVPRSATFEGDGGQLTRGDGFEVLAPGDDGFDEALAEAKQFAEFDTEDG